MAASPEATSPEARHNTKPFLDGRKKTVVDVKDSDL